MLSPLLIGMAATNHSIGLGIALLGISYAICALVPGLFIQEKMFDPRAIAPAAAEYGFAPSVGRART
jgi:hypothetical protein